MSHEHWQHKVVEIHADTLGSINAEQLQRVLDQHGAQGWELVAVTQLAINRATLYFKKRK